MLAPTRDRTQNCRLSNLVFSESSFGSGYGFSVTPWYLLSELPNMRERPTAPTMSMLVGGCFRVLIMNARIGRCCGGGDRHDKCICLFHVFSRYFSQTFNLVLSRVGCTFYLFAGWIFTLRKLVSVAPRVNIRSRRLDGFSRHLCRHFHF